MPIKGLLFLLLIAALVGVFIETEFGGLPDDEYYEDEFEEENER